MKAEKLEVVGREFHERRHLTHKRMERWIRLQQFVYGLPEEYAYAVRISTRNGRTESSALVTVGWMSWFGRGLGSDRQHSLGLALLNASEALSANGTRLFLHNVARWLLSCLNVFRPRREASRRSELPAEIDHTDLLAG
ncbi:MAG TPA: hypothetical protein VIH99_12950 [Bdellovibrionota bacterium]|jgi:hypothetical protein